MINVRQEMPQDAVVIRALLTNAFDGAEEADLVERLRAEGAVVSALVAEEGVEILGHILFSRLPLETDGRSIRGAALAPLAVRPDRQSQGIGSRLVRHGLEACHAQDVAAVIVVGEPRYYARFGFSAEKAGLLRAPFSGPAFMALELTPGALQGISAQVRYAAAFGPKDF